MMFKILVIQAANNLSDERAEFLIAIDLILDGVQALIDRRREAG